MATASFSEHSVTIFQFTRCHMPDSWIFSLYVTVIPCNLVGEVFLRYGEFTDSVIKVEYRQWLCKCRVLVQRFTCQITEECHCAEDHYESSKPCLSQMFRFGPQLLYGTFFFRRGVYLTNCTEMLFASFDWFSSSNMYVLQSPMYDSYASNLSVYSVHEHQDQWMARSILNWFFILNFFSAPSVKWRDSVLKYVTDVSFHILANSVFTVIQLLHAV